MLDILQTDIFNLRCYQFDQIGYLRQGFVMILRDNPLDRFLGGRILKELFFIAVLLQSTSIPCINKLHKLISFLQSHIYIRHDVDIFVPLLACDKLI